MAGRSLPCLALLICICQLRHGTHWTLAAPTTDLAPTVVTEVSDNGSSFSEEWNRTDSKDIWQITETAGNEPTNNPNELYFRSSWTTPKTHHEHENYESEEGWLDGAIISKDVFIPYRALGLWDRFGNNSDDWKKYLVKASDKHLQDRVLRIEHHVRQKSPFDYYTHLWKKLPSTTPINT